MERFYVTTVLLLTGFIVSAQQDSTFNKVLEELVITATRTERKLSNTAVPVQLVTQKNISQSGSLRLNDILTEQTGLYISNNRSGGSAGGGVFGSGVQIQGLSPDYTLVLLDGEPIIGRQGGIIDLARIAVGNIKKIEIVKGPSSSLYGSEAMGGVVNIITEEPRRNRLDGSLRWGRFRTTDAVINAALKKEKWYLGFFGNNNRSDGFDLDKNTAEKTLDPRRNYTSQIRMIFQPTVKTKLSFTGRYFTELQENFFIISDQTTGNDMAISGTGVIKDLNVNPVLIQQFSDKLRSSLRLYFSRYQFDQQLQKKSDGTNYYLDFFRQDFYRAENQTDWHWEKNNFLTVGGGFVKENLNTTRYAGKRSHDIRYIFLQEEWKADEKFTVIGGIRVDDNSAYQSKLSPKLAAHFNVSKKFRINFSYGAGFKAPDFRQLYLNFTNNAAGGYTIYGANEITIDQLEQQKQQGRIAEILPKAYQLALLKPEKSSGCNMGFHYAIHDRLKVSGNFFRNDINGLIQVDMIAINNNQSPVYSYFNVNRAFTKGAEIQFHYSINNNLSFNGGYQFLVTADKDVLEQIKNGKLYARSMGANQSYLLKRSEYAGLANRSAHMANAKLIYDNSKTGWSGSVRAIFRSRWGTYDKDGNGIINRSDEFAKGFMLLNILVAKKIHALNLQLGIDNLLNYKDPLDLPGQPGIQPYLSVSYLFNQKNKKNKS